MLILSLVFVSLQAQLRELQQVAEDLQVKLEDHRRKKNDADRLKEETLKALEAGDSGKCNATVNLPWFGWSVFKAIWSIDRLVTVWRCSQVIVAATTGQLPFNFSGLTLNKSKLTPAPQARQSGWQMVEHQEQLEGLNTDACAIEINELGEECWATAYCSPTALPFTFLKPSERSCLWLTGKFPYRSKHKLPRHLSDVQTCVGECTRSCGAGWEMGSVIFALKSIRI